MLLRRSTAITKTGMTVNLFYIPWFLEYYSNKNEILLAVTPPKEPRQVHPLSLLVALTLCQLTLIGGVYMFKRYSEKWLLDKKST
jgi:hypothetical protein